MSAASDTENRAQANVVDHQGQTTSGADNHVQANAADHPDQTGAAVSATVPRSAKLKRVGKLLLDMAPILSGLLDGMTSSPTMIYACAWIGMLLAGVAVVVDYFHCKHRWDAKQPAVWPKLIILAFFMMNLVVLIMLHAAVISIDWVQQWSGLIMSGGVFVAASTSLLVGKPFVYAYAVEFMPPEKWQLCTESSVAMAVLIDITRAVTLLWSVLFFVLFGVGMGLAFVRLAGHKEISTIAGIVTPIVLTSLTVRVFQPKVIEKVRERAKSREEAKAKELRQSDSLHTPLSLV